MLMTDHLTREHMEVSSLSNKCLFQRSVFPLLLDAARFVSKRSSSSIDLATSSTSSSLDAIALSVGLSWPPVKRQRSAGRPSWQHLWEHALQERILHHHELPHGVSAYTGQAGGDQERPCQHSLCPWSPPSPAAARQNAAKSTPTASYATGSSTF